MKKIRYIIRKIGQLNTVIIVTVFSILTSVLLTSFIFYLKQDYSFLRPSIYMAAFVPLIVAPLASWPLVRLVFIIDNLEKEMRRLATYDSLTELLNRRAFFHDSTNFISYAQREHIDISVIALDLDNFKHINDSHGHAVGDLVLKHFAKTIKATIRNGDFSGRIGGDEFVLFLPNTPVYSASTLAERLHDAVRKSVIHHGDSSIKYTVSMGVISLSPKKIDSIESILKVADESLYLAKERGRNCSEIFSDNKSMGLD